MADRMLDINELENVTGGAQGDKQTGGRPYLTCPRCQCPDFKWSGKQYTCKECGYQGYAQ